MTPSPRLVLSIALLLSSVVAGQTAAGAFWLTRRTGTESMSPKLHEMLALRVGPNAQASSDYHDFQDVQLNETLEAWRLLHGRASDFAGTQVRLFRPQLAQLLNEAKVSENCSLAVEHFLSSAEGLRSWAVQMWSATGNFPPVGLLDGHFTDLGSYRGCVDAKDDDQGGKYAASYCLVGFRPVVPSRRRFHQIFKQEDARLTQLFHSGDVLGRASHWAQYFHYLYMKTGICAPVSCSPRDLQQVSLLIGQRLALISAPVKCFTRSREADSTVRRTASDQLGPDLIDNEPILVSLNMQLSRAQLVSLALVGSFFALVLLASLWHALELVCQGLSSPTQLESDEGTEDDKSPEIGGRNQQAKLRAEQIEGGQLRHLAFEYFSLLTNGREFCATSMRAHEIKCLHGLRAITMIWIICVHTLQYNDWSGFSRAFENEISLQNLVVHPLINANYVVDNFFLMSGLLAAYTIWNSNKGAPANNFSALNCLVGRFLRLTPQVLLISLLNILLPLISDGPFWYDMTHKAALNCEQNWWVNLLHIQSFYRKESICNLVGWWISVDMLYYVIALPLLWLLLNKQPKRALTCTCLVVGACVAVAAYRHYMGGFTPNNLGTVPQIGEVWTEFVVAFFWSPYPHAPAFFLGLWLGYALANRKLYRQVRAHSKVGWRLAIVSLLGVNFSSRLWITGFLEHSTERQYIATSYNILCVLIWAVAFGWIIMACHYGCAPNVNRFLASESFILLSKSSFIIYLSHMLIVRAFYGSQYNLMEISLTTFVFTIIGIVVISIGFGIFLCIAFEGPSLKFQKFVMDKLRRERKLPIADASYATRNYDQNGMQSKVFCDEGKISLGFHPTNMTLLK